MKLKSYVGAKLGIIAVSCVLFAAVPMTSMAENNSEGGNAEAVENTQEETEIIEYADKELDSNETESVNKLNEPPTFEVDMQDKIAEESDLEIGDMIETDEVQSEGENKDESVEENDNSVEVSRNESDKEASEDLGSEAETTENKEANGLMETEKKTETEKVVESELSEEIIGTWDLDGYTGFKFDNNRNGKLIAGEHELVFKYTINGDELKLKFTSSKAINGAYTASVTGDILHLIGGEGTIGASFDLNRMDDRTK